MLKYTASVYGLINRTQGPRLQLPLGDPPPTGKPPPTLEKRQGYRIERRNQYHIWEIMVLLYKAAWKTKVPCGIHN